jgi:protein-S-isoprenylcysteine O-methyltransferase Ste14
VAAQVAVVAAIVLCEFLGPSWAAAWAHALAPLGVVLAALGILLFLAGLVSLGRSLSPLPKPRDDASMRERGAYAWVRHPMYAGVIVAVLGLSLAASPLGLAATALGALFLDRKSAREETWLVERYPGYDGYRRRVRWKFVPGIR